MPAPPNSPPTSNCLSRANMATIPKLARRIGWAFLAAGAIAATVVGLIGIWRANRLADRVGRINRAFREPDQPSLQALEEGSAETDEIGELTRHTSEALAHLRRMVGAHRETTDQVAHELRTPLMHLDNRLVKALAKAQDEDDRRLLSDARAEIRHVIALLESLLDIATSEARKGDRSGLSPVNLSQLVNRIAELYADSAEDSGHTFTRSIMPGITCQGEEMQLTRLITNLLDNAFKYVLLVAPCAFRSNRGRRFRCRTMAPAYPRMSASTSSTASAVAVRISRRANPAAATAPASASRWPARLPSATA